MSHCQKLSDKASLRWKQTATYLYKIRMLINWMVCFYWRFLGTRATTCLLNIPRITTFIVYWNICNFILVWVGIEIGHKESLILFVNNIEVFVPKTKPKIVNYPARRQYNYPARLGSLLQVCCRQVLIRMNSNRLHRLDDNKSAAGWQQTWSMLIDKTKNSPAWYKFLQQLAGSLQIPSCIKI